MSNNAIKMKMKITYTTSYMISFNRFFSEALRLKEKDRIAISIDHEKTFIQFHKALDDTSGYKFSLRKGSMKIYNKQLIRMLIDCLQLTGSKWNFDKAVCLYDNGIKLVRFRINGGKR